MAHFKKILHKEKDRLLKMQLDLVSKCRYENKYILINYSGIDWL